MQVRIVPSSRHLCLTALFLLQEELLVVVNQQTLEVVRTRHQYPQIVEDLSDLGKDKNYHEFQESPFLLRLNIRLYEVLLGNY